MRIFVRLFALALAIVLVVAVPHEGHNHGGHDYVVKTHEDLTHYREHCSTKLNIDSAVVEKYKKWEYPDDEKTHCYMKCVMEQFGFFDDEHGFNVHNIHHQVGHGGHIDHSDALHGKIAACAEKKPEYGDDKCKWAYNGGMCFLRQNLQLVQNSVKEH